MSITRFASGKLSVWRVLTEEKDKADDSSPRAEQAKEEGATTSSGLSSWDLFEDWALPGYVQQRLW